MSHLCCQYCCIQRGTQCYACDANAEANLALTECLCNPGWAANYTVNFETNSLETHCIECPEGAVCDFVGAVWNEMATAVGYWAGAEVGTYYRCLLIYPSVCATIFGIFVCKNVEGTSYLVSDFNLHCYTSELQTVAQYSYIFMLVYPLGIPIFFYNKLAEYAYGKTGTNRLDQKGVRCQLGFLYDGFERRVWWFELVDMLHKVIATSLISFFPLEYQLPMAMLLMTIYLQVLLLNSS